MTDCKQKSDWFDMQKPTSAYGRVHILIEKIPISLSDFAIKLGPIARTLGWFKNPVSSQTEKLMAGTKFSDYFGLKHYKNAKKLKHFNHLGLAQRPQSFAT